MSVSRITSIVHRSFLSSGRAIPLNGVKRTATTSQSGGILPEPKRAPLGLFGLVCAVIPGLLVGAMISKNIANFLEENDLFVPSDDDDDDD